MKANMGDKVRLTELDFQFTSKGKTCYFLTNLVTNPLEVLYHSVLRHHSTGGFDRKLVEERKRRQIYKTEGNQLDMFGELYAEEAEEVKKGLGSITK